VPESNDPHDGSPIVDDATPKGVADTGGQGRIADLFRISDFRRLLGGTLISSFGMWSERLAVSWFVFNATGSVLLTGLVATSQYAQRMIFGPLAGALADRYPRNRIIATAALVKVSAVLTIAGLVSLEHPPLVLLFCVIVVSAIGGTFTGSSLQTLAGDIVGPAMRARAVSLVWTGQRAVAALGGMATGALIGSAGVSWSVLLSASMLALAALVYSGVADPRPRRTAAVPTSLIGETFEGLRMVRHDRTLATLLALAAAAEVFGFSYTALLPALAERTLHVDAVGFGALSAVAGIGSVVATLCLTAADNRVRRGLLLIGVFAVFGSLLIALGSSRVYWLSLLIALGLGGCTALIDTLEVIMLQAVVEDRLRGRALGAWNMAYGLGWMGPMILGAVADAVSLSAAYTLAGCVLIAIAAGTAVTAPRLRNTR